MPPPIDPSDSAQVYCVMYYPFGSQDFKNCVSNFVRPPRINTDFALLTQLIKDKYGESAFGDNLIPDFAVSFNINNQVGFANAVYLYSVLSRAFSAARCSGTDLTFVLICDKTPVNLIAFGAPPTIPPGLNSNSMTFPDFAHFFNYMEAL